MTEQELTVVRIKLSYMLLMMVAHGAMMLAIIKELMTTPQMLVVIGVIVALMQIHVHKYKKKHKRS